MTQRDATTGQWPDAARCAATTTRGTRCTFGGMHTIDGRLLCTAHWRAAARHDKLARCWLQAAKVPIKSLAWWRARWGGRAGP